MHLAKRVLNSDFLKQNTIVLVGSVLVGAGNYLFYPILARLLSPGPYGEVQALAALFLQLTILLVVLGQVTVNVVANYKDEHKKLEVIQELEKASLLLTIGISVILAIFSFKLKSFFQFESVFPFILLLIALIISIPGSFRNAYLRGKKDFTSSSIALIIGAFGKVLLSAGLVLAGFATSGAIGGIVAAQILAFWYAAKKAKQRGYIKSTDSKYLQLPSMKVLYPELRYALLVLVCSGSITFLSGLDIFVVKHYFDPVMAGKYAGVSAVAKIVFFITASVAQVLLPSVKIKSPRQENRMLLLKSLGLVTLIGSVSIAAFTLAPELITGILMGSDFTAEAHLLPRLSIAMFSIAILNIVVSYYLALREYSIGIIVLIGVSFTGWLMATNQQDLTSVVNNLTSGSAITLILFTIWRLWRLATHVKHK